MAVSQPYDEGVSVTNYSLYLGAHSNLGLDLVHEYLRYVSSCSAVICVSWELRSGARASRCSLLPRHIPYLLLPLQHIHTLTCFQRSSACALILIGLPDSLNRRGQHDDGYCEQTLSKACVDAVTTKAADTGYRLTKSISNSSVPGMAAKFSALGGSITSKPEVFRNQGLEGTSCP